MVHLLHRLYGVDAPDYVAGPPLLNERYTSLLRAPRLRNDLYCVEWDVKLYYTIPYHTIPYRILSLCVV